MERGNSNQSDAHLSYDDDETTEWSNDGRLATGIIEYELEREANLHQAVFKFAGWRRISYPISIYVDNKEVYRGNTPRSLGYVTFDFGPVKGKKVRVQLIGSTSDNDTFDIVEITGKVDTAGLDEDEKNTRGSLQIIEAEFYEPVESEE